MSVRFRISSYFTLAVAATALVVLVQDGRVAVVYAVACAAVVAPLYLLRVPRRFFFVLLFAMTAIWLTHHLRVPFLLAYPEGFKYSRVGMVTPDLIRETLWQLTFGSILLGLGLWVGFRSFTSRLESEAGSTEKASRPFFVRASALLAVVVVVILFARAFLQLGLGLETKNVETATFGFLSQLLPDFLLFPVVIIYLLKYRRRITRFERSIFLVTLIGMLVLSVLSGSRSGFARLALAIFIFLLVERGDFRIGAFKVAILGVIGAWLLILTFSVAGPIRGYFASGGSYGLGMHQFVTAGFQRALNEEALPVLGSAVSSRVSGGMDGMLAVEQYRPGILLDAFTPQRMAAKAAEKLIPQYNPAWAVSTGKTIGVAYAGHSWDQRHSSNLGLFAALRMMFGSPGLYLACFVVGLFWAVYFRLVEVFQDPDFVLLLHFIGLQQVMGWVISGNLDIIIPGTIINIVLLLTYGLFTAGTALSVGSVQTGRLETFGAGPRMRRSVGEIH